MTLVDVRDARAAKRGRRIAVCVPARDEAATVALTVGAALSLDGLLDDVVVVDDGSTDRTAAVAAAAGATVLPAAGGPGKGQAMRTAIAAVDADLYVFCDADVRNVEPWWIARLVLPALLDPAVHLVKGSYRRPLDGGPDGGGRVTELVARPLLRRFFPELADVRQPLAGETVLTRAAADGLGLADGYGVEIGLLVDVWRRWGRDAVAEVDLGTRIHRNRPLADLIAMADVVLDEVLARAGVGADQRSAP